MAETPQSSSLQQPHHLLTATYRSPTNAPFNHAHNLPALSSPASTSDRTAYLAALKKATAEMQETINAELTARMEEDKAREAGTQMHGGSGSGKGKIVDEAKEEDNYGEEVAEED